MPAAESKQGAIVFRPEDLQIVAAIQEKTGLLTRADVVRYALRRCAAAEGISVQKSTPPKSGKRGK